MPVFVLACLLALTGEGLLWCSSRTGGAVEGSPVGLHRSRSRLRRSIPFRFYWLFCSIGPPTLAPRITNQHASARESWGPRRASQRTRSTSCLSLSETSTASWPLGGCLATLLGCRPHKLYFQCSIESIFFVARCCCRVGGGPSKAVRCDVLGVFGCFQPLLMSLMDVPWVVSLLGSSS
jgi:hypothetical protein